MIFTRPLLHIACVALLLCAGGCAEATIATAATVAGIAATGVSTGADVYRMGKLNSVDMTSFEELRDSVRKSAVDLQLTLVSQEDYEPGKWRCRLEDDEKTPMRVYIEKRTGKLCRTRIDVGVFGSEPTARLLLARMRQHLPTPPPAVPPLLVPPPA
jgi:hypothetical protein